MNESGGRFGAVGDHGTSFGPWQLHVGGALPAGKGAAWANSRAGVLYALRKMAESGARGLHGQAAVSSIARNFERPADPGAEIRTALSYYRQPGFARGSAAAGAGGGGIARGGGGARSGRGNPAALALLSAQHPISVTPMAPMQTAASKLQNLFAAQPASSGPASMPAVPSTAPGPDAFASQLDTTHTNLLRQL